MVKLFLIWKEVERTKIERSGDRGRPQKQYKMVPIPSLHNEETELNELNEGELAGEHDE